MFDFQLWSKRNPAVKTEVYKEFPLLRSFDDLNNNEKNLIWSHLYLEFGFPESRNFIDFENIEDSIKDLSRISAQAVTILNYNSQYKSYGRNLITEHNWDAALKDFKNIFLTESQSVVFELLSIFSKLLIEKSNKDAKYISRGENEKESVYLKRKTDNLYSKYDNFSQEINYTFSQFGINVKFTRIGLISRQAKVVEKELIEPVMGILSDSKFEQVNRDLQSALNDFHELRYADSMTKFIAAFEEFIQISIGDNSITFSNGVKKGVKLGIFPDDLFSKNIFENADSILSQMRKKYGTAHSPDDIPSQKDVQIVMNLIFIFIQHCS